MTTIGETGEGIVHRHGALLKSRLAGEVAVEHGARYRRRLAAAAAAVFYDHCDFVLRGFHRRKGDEQGVVAQPRVDLAGLVFLVLLEAEYLRRTRLARHVISDAARDALHRATGCVDQVLHRPNHRNPIGGVRHGYFTEVRGRLHHELGLAGRLCRAQHVGLEMIAAIGEGRDGLGELHGRREHEALTDACDERLAGVPGLLARRALPFARWQEATEFGREIDIGLGAETKIAQIFVHAIDTERACEVVKIHVAGVHVGEAHIYRAVAALLPVAVAVLVAGQR